MDVQAPARGSSSRNILRRLIARELEDVNGIATTCYIGPTSRAVAHSDPFLVLAAFGLRSPSSIPSTAMHGYECATYVLPSSESALCSDTGVTIRPGDLEWLTAGRGTLRPATAPAKPAPGEAAARMVRAVQLCLNLPSRLKWCEPACAVLRGERAPVVQAGGIERVDLAASDAGSAGVAGDAGGSGGSGALTPRCCCRLRRYTLQPGSAVFEPLPASWAVVVLILAGAARFGRDDPHASAAAPAALLFSDGAGEDGADGADGGSANGGAGGTDSVAAGGSQQQGLSIFCPEGEESGCSFLICGAERNGEPIVRQGPFVSPSMASMQRALREHGAGNFVSL